MLSRFLLIIAGLFAGMWLRDANGTIYDIGYAAFAVVSLLLAVATTPPTNDGDARARLSEAFQKWLLAWHRTNGVSERERPAAEEALRHATSSMAIVGNGAVVKSLRRAVERGLAPRQVAQLALDVRRQLRSGGVALRVDDLEPLLAAPAPRAAASVGADNGRGDGARAIASAGAGPTSFII